MGAQRCGRLSVCFFFFLLISASLMCTPMVAFVQSLWRIIDASLLTTAEPLAPSSSESVFNELCGRSGQKVAVVMPFIERQVPDLKQNVQTWAKFFPCSSSFVRPRPFMKLFFFFNNAHNKTLEQELLENWNSIKDTQYNDGNGTVSLHECFEGPPELLAANLNEVKHDHTRNTAKQLSVLFTLLRERNVSFFFQMEPDCFAIKPKWVNKIYLESVCGDMFWLKGSNFRNAQNWHMSAFGPHYNGNALYSTDKAFSDWIDKVILKRFGNYDLSIAGELRTDHAFYRDFGHLFRYVDWIYNYGSMYDSRPYVGPWTPEQMNVISPNTYLLHGKK